MSHAIYGRDDDAHTPEQLILRNLHMAMEALVEVIAGNTSAALSMPDTVRQSRRLFKELNVQLPNMDPYFDGIVKRIAEDRKEP